MPENQPDPHSTANEPPRGGEPRVLSSVDLLAGRQEVMIQHKDQVYRLRLTASGKLILVK